MSKIFRQIKIAVPVCIFFVIFTVLSSFSVIADVNTIRYEAESIPFTVTDSTGHTTSVNKESKWAWTLNLGGARNVSGKLTYFRSGGLGSTVDFNVDVQTAGEYGVVWAYRPSDVSYSTIQVLVNGKEIGGEISQKAGMKVGGEFNVNETVRTVTLGNADFNEGSNTVTFKLVGLGRVVADNDAETEAAAAFTFDYLELGDTVDESKLTFTEEPIEYPDVATMENSTPATADIPEGMLDSYAGVSADPATTDKITVWPLAECYTTSSKYTLTADGVDVPVTSLAGEYEYASFDYDPSRGAVDIEISCDAEVESLVVSPQHINTASSYEGNKISLTIEENYTYALCINGKYLLVSADPMETDVPEKSGDGIFNVTEAPYSVTASMTDAERTSAIQSALDDASVYGSAAGNKNGVVYIPAGVYSVGNLVIGSNTYLYLEGGAALQITDDTSLLTVHGCKNSMTDPYGKGGIDYTWWISTAFSENGKEVNGSYDIRIAGRGTIDGRDQHYWDKSAPGNHKIGNNTIVPIACSYFTCEGLTVREGVCWSVVPVRSDNVTMSWLKLLQRFDRMLEDDGIDVCECQDVLIDHCISFAKDDTFSTKTWPYRVGITLNWPGAPEYLKNVTFEDCVAYTDCICFKVGMGMDQNQYDVTFKGCTALSGAVGLGVHINSGGGTVYNILYEDCYVENLHGNLWNRGGWMIILNWKNNRGDGNADGITFKNIQVYKEAKNNYKLEITGCNSNALMKNITFTNIYYDGALIESLDKMIPGITTNDYALNIQLVNDIPDDPTVYSVDLDKDSTELKVGETDTLTAVVSPNTDEKLIWTSSDDTVAKVDENGTVTAIGAGTAVITAALSDGASASCTVTVTEPEKPFLPGDLDDNGVVNVSDILTLKNLIMTGSWSEEQLKSGDIDNNETLNVSDILAIKNIIMTA